MIEQVSKHFPMLPSSNSTRVTGATGFPEIVREKISNTMQGKSSLGSGRVTTIEEYLISTKEGAEFLQEMLV